MSAEDTRIASLAAQQFHAKGITATGVDTLSKAAGISKRTLYERFGSKNGLIVAAYESLDLPVYRMFTEAAEHATDDPRAQLEIFFARLEQIVRMPEFRGCPFTNAAAELPDPDHPAHAVVRRHKGRIRRWLQQRAAGAGARDPQLLARELMLVFAGVQTQALVEGSARPARDAARLANAVIEAALAR